MRKIKILILLVITLVQTNQVLALQNNSALFSFLELPVSPKQAFLGTYNISSPNPDVLSTIGNPAFLDSSLIRSAQIAYVSHFDDANFSTIGYAFSIKPKIFSSVVLRFMNYGSQTKRDINGVDLGEFRAYDLALSNYYSYLMSSKFKIGTGLTFIRSSIDNFSSHGLTLTTGAFYEIDELSSVGISVRDIGFQFHSFNQTDERIPMDLSIAYSKKMKYVPFRINAVFHSIEEWPIRTIYDTKTPDFSTSFFRHFAFGGEFLFSQSFQLHFGFNKRMADDLTTDSRIDFSGTNFGASFKIGQFDIDISRTSFSTVGSHLQLSLASKF